MKTKFKTSPKSQKESILENNNFRNNQNYILGKKNINFIILKEIFNNEMAKNKKMAEYDSRNDFSSLINFVFKICFNLIKILYLFEKKLKVKTEIIFIVINYLIIKFILISLSALFIKYIDIWFYNFFIIFFSNTYCSWCIYIINILF